ncbi:MAG TPA: Gfo/Idh/MocA family oxidoreductase [Candidatus Lachnoclostridium stercorigallinarum]|uniref:Gfo/Idh/MocA family oxidoreductase n=1 Tax=Candidatus Lachnoclostridium stercorigallinarum TaxID=2838634 RepID=A0A9D2GHM4_9FIRM|nr:Gfo/Idh/MocA family oxidoreductase [Candidatus Lachnoclostridium stercorigallinarum]
MVRLAIIGTSKIAATFAQAARMSGCCSLEAVYSRKEETGKAFAQIQNIPKVTVSLEELAAMDGVDAVYIASPNSCHGSQALAMLKAGKHVLLEKPAVPTEREFQALEEEADRQGVIFLEAMRTAFDPGMDRIKELLEQIGPVRRATLEYSQYSSRYDAYKRGEILNAFNPALANAAVMDIGVYAVYSLVRLFGEPQSVCGTSVFLKNGMEGIGTILAGYPDMIGEVLYSKITDSARGSQIEGEKGSVLIDRIEQPGRIVVKTRGGEEQEILLESQENPLYFEVKEFCRMAEGGLREEAAVHRERTRIQLRIMEEFRKKSGIVFPGEG